MKNLALTLLFCLFPFALVAQNQTGLPTFGSFSSGGFDTINNQNLDVYFAIPIFSSQGRGLPLSLSLSFNSLLWQNSGGTWTSVTDSNGNPTWGWQKDFPAGGSVSYRAYSRNEKCEPAGNMVLVYYYNTYVYTDALGTAHPFPINFYESDCSNYNGGTRAPAYASDNTGYYIANAYAPVVLGPNGQQVTASATSTAIDVNGNYVTKTVVKSNETDWTDSTGKVALKIVYTPNTTSPTSVTYSFLDGTGTSHYQSITLKYSPMYIQTAFGCNNVIDYNVNHTLGPSSLPTELDIPTPSGTTLKYLFAYEPTPGSMGYFTGRIQTVTLPTGGTYTYTYSGLGFGDGINCSNGSTVRMNRTISDGTNSATWQFYYNTANNTMTETIPQLADTAQASATVYTFNSSGQEIIRQIYADTVENTLLRSVNTSWAPNGTPATQVTILEDNSTKSETDTTYDSYGNLDTLTEYDWGTGTHGSPSPIRTTSLSYVTGTNYTSRNILDLLSSKQISDGTGTIQYRQDIAYDGSAPDCSDTGALQHDDTDFPCTINVRGNPTMITTYLTPSGPSNGVAKTFTYDWFGNLRTAQLNCCTSKTWLYSSATQYSQPDTVTSGTSPTQLTTSYTYYSDTKQVMNTVDPNGLETDYTYDFLRRTTQVSQKNGSTSGSNIGYTYIDANFETEVSTTLDSINSVHQYTVADALGRPATTAIEDANNNLYSEVQTKFDLLGRAYSTSNPFTSSAQYWTTTSFDALGRTTKVSLPDNPSSAYGYGYTTKMVIVTDPAGKQRESVFDAAGRLSSVFESNTTNGGLTVQTLYTYTVLDQLASTADASSSPTQTRTYTYDALGRLLSTITPEGGKTCFGSVSGSTCNTDGYDNFDNLVKRTDARGVLTSYVYDGLNRLTQVSYNVSGATGVPATPTVGLTYGTSSCTSAHGVGCIGQLITLTDGAGSENYTYNALEHLTQLQKVIGTTTYNTQYAYNLAGQLTQLTYPSGRVVQQNIDPIGRVCSVGTSGSTCTTGTTYATGYAYSPAQQLTGFQYGNGIYASLGYSQDQLQLSCLDYSTTNRNGSCTHDSTTKFGLTYSYGSAGSNNGQIAGITDAVDGGRTINYTYDQLARISNAVTNGSTNYAKWSLSWVYDRYGNRTDQNQGYGNPPMNHVLVNAATNRITTSGYAYDANGNMTNDGFNTMVYDAENHATSAANGGSAGAYTYDGNALRVKKCVPNCTSPTTTTVYLFSGSKVLAEYDNGAAVGSPSREYIYSGGALLAKVDASGTKYYHQDHLSNRLVTSSTGATLEQLGHYPFGESWYNSTGDKLTFTTYERDAESGNDFAMARYYINRLGRFSSLDPLSGSIADPQSLNRYAYTENNPILFVDPSGMELTASCGDYYSCGGGGGGAGGLSSDPAPTWTPPTIECDSNGNCTIKITVNEKGDPPLPPLPPLTNPGYTDPSQGSPADLATSNPIGCLSGCIPIVIDKPLPPLECRPQFLERANAAWDKVGHGAASNEAGFRMSGSWTTTTFTPLPTSNVNGKISFDALPTDIAIFHTHPSLSSPYPSGPPSVDLGYLRPGDKAYVPVYTASTSGLYVSDPAAKNGRVLVRAGLSWLKPCL